MIRLIGFSGFARSGKDTAAQALLYRGWTRAAFADALKHDAGMALRNSLIAGHHNPPSEDIAPWFSDPDMKEAFRPFLVEYGRAMRKIHSDYWVTRLFADLLPDVRYAITDVRYVNEADYIRKLGGKIVRITRLGIEPANHEEEASLKAFEPDCIICNSGSIHDLHESVTKYAKELENT